MDGFLTKDTLFGKSVLASLGRNWGFFGAFEMFGSMLTL